MRNEELEQTQEAAYRGEGSLPTCAMAIEHLRAALAEAKRERDALVDEVTEQAMERHWSDTRLAAVEVLREVEWVDGGTVTGERCPVCEGLKPWEEDYRYPHRRAQAGHREDCRLAAVLAGEGTT